MLCRGVFHELRAYIWRSGLSGGRHACIRSRVHAPAPSTRGRGGASIVRRALLATMSAASSSSRRRNYLLHPHRTDGLIGFIKDMLHHSFVLDTMASTTDATWRHIEELIEEHRAIVAAVDAGKQTRASRLGESVPTVSRFFTPLPLRAVRPATFCRVGLPCLQRIHRSPPNHSPLPPPPFDESRRRLLYCRPGPCTTPSTR